MILVFVWSTLSRTQFSRQFASVEVKLSSRKRIQKKHANFNSKKNLTKAEIIN